MVLTSASLILLSAISYGQLATGENCLTNIILDNDTYIDSTYRIVEFSTLYGCAAECMTAAVCSSFSFENNGRCHLNNNSNVSEVTIPKYGFVSSVVATWPKSIAGPCGHVECPYHEKCVVQRNMKTRCIPEFTTCGEPLAKQGADIVLSGQEIGAVVTYVCRQDYVACTNQTESVCRPDRTWDDPGEVCEKTTWNTPDVPRVFSIPCGRRSELVVQFEGKLTQNTVQWKLYYSESTYFLVSVRFQQNETVLNSFLNDEWGVEVRSLLTILPNTTHLFEITLSDGNYKYSVDGNLIDIFSERQVGGQPSHFYRQGSLRISYLKINI